MFAVIVAGREAKSDNGAIVSKKGDRYWVINDDGGWVEATSKLFNGYGVVPGDLKLFTTREKAETFIRRWKGHPWWCKPTRDYEILSVTPMTQTVIVGYKVSKCTVS